LNNLINIIKSLNYSNDEIIRDILELHVPSKRIDLDPTYSKGVFYKSGVVPQPIIKSDLYPKSEGVLEACATNIPLPHGGLNSIMFDPPFVISTGPSLKDETTEGINMTSRRFGSFPNIQSLWKFYNDALSEFYRVLKPGGIVIFKCQDTVTSGKNYMSHCEVYKMAIENGFHAKDLFILAAKNRLNSFGGKWKTQRHARKYHSYFFVFQKLPLR
jgi:hypothetical protein